MRKVNIHTVEQPDSDTTTFVLSCNRLEVLDKTINSFYLTADYVTKMVIVDDSGVEGVFETLVDRYGHDCDIICFPNNRSQWWAMDFMVSYCDTEYIFYLEDDWELLKPGYLNASKQILQKYREVGTVDISRRTFDWQGIDSYHTEVVDGMFQWKKPWKITDHHLAWYGWIGSPNLKRRDDLIMLGRVEKWHNEWNIDRKFEALGFRAVYLLDKYVEHLGDTCSAMEGKRPDDSKIPYDYYPKEILERRRAPYLNFREMDWIYPYPADVTIVTGLLDISRGDRSFEEHYIKGLDKLLAIRNPLVVYAEKEWHEYIINRRRELSLATSNNRIEVREFSREILEQSPFYQDVQNLISHPEWINQADWMKNSALVSQYYVMLTLTKPFMLDEVAMDNPFGSKRFYWVDSGICNSFHIEEPLTNFNFLKIPDNGKYNVTSYPYYALHEIHGYNIRAMTNYIGKRPEYVCRATIFGGDYESIQKFTDKYYEAIDDSLMFRAIGTEEAIFTIVEMKNPDLVERFAMPSGDIKHYLNMIRK